ncbi:MAG: NUDIX domain-containing protein [Chloroflexi bacterium]|nr:NUDIX domain-containing protein [Chloroflexota bacterium]
MAHWNWRNGALKIMLVVWWLLRPRTIGMRGIVTDDAGRILMVRHQYGNRRWYLPGGGGEGNETAAEGIVREMHEETGLAVEVTRLVGVYFWTGAYKRDHIFVFACRWLSGTLQIQKGEIAEVGWFDLDHLPQPIDPGLPCALRDWQEGRVGYGRWGEGENSGKMDRRPH